VSATVDLNGESQESARVQIMRMLDVALAQRMLPAGSDIRLVDHTIEQATVQPDRRTPSSDTDFSQLLDL
jgi:chorismate synthase